MPSIRKNTLFNIFLSISQILFSIATFPYVSRILGPSGVGTYTFMDNYTQYFVWIAALGIPIYGTREIAKVRLDYGERSQVFSELLIIHVSFTLIVVGVYVSSFFFIPALFPYRFLLLLGTLLLSSSVFSIEWLYQGLEEFQYIASRAVFIRGIAILLIFCFVKQKGDVWLYYGINCGAVCMNAVVNMILSRHKIHFRYKGWRLRRHIKPLTFIFSSVLVTNVYTLLDSVLLGMMTDSKSVGYYTTAVKLSKILIFLITAMTTALIPALSLAYKEKRNEDVSRLLEKSFEYISFLGVPLSIGLIVVSKPLILLFGGNAFLPAVPLLNFLAPTILIIGFSHLLGMQILNPIGRENLFFRATMVGMVVSIVGNLCLIPFFRESGAAWVNVGVEFTVMLLLAYFVKKILVFQPKWSALFKAGIACIPFFFVKMMILALNLNSLYTLVLLIFGCSLVYAGIQWWGWKNRLMVEMVTWVKGAL